MNVLHQLKSIDTYVQACLSNRKSLKIRTAVRTMAVDRLNKYRMSAHNQLSCTKEQVLEAWETMRKH